MEKLNKKDLISALWVVVMLNMLKADILSLYVPGTAIELAKTAGETPITKIMLGGSNHNGNSYLDDCSDTDVKSHCKPLV